MSTNALQQFMREIRALLSPLAEVAADQEVRREVLLSLGLRPGPVVPNLANPQTGFDNIDRYIQATDPDLTAFASAVGDVVNILTALESLIELVRAADEEAAAEELLNLFVSMLTLGYLRARQPSIYAFFAALGVIGEQGLDLERFLSVFRGGGLGPLPPTEQEVRDISDAIFLPVATLVAVTAMTIKQDFKIGYGWDAAPGSASPLADRIAARTFFVGWGSAPSDGAAQPELSGELGTAWALVPAVHGGPALAVHAAGTGELEVPLGRGWKLKLEVGPAGFTLRLGQGGGIVGPQDARVKVELGRDPKDAPNREKAVLGNVKGMRLELGDMEAEAEISGRDAGLELRFKESEFIFILSGPLFPSGEIRVRVDLGLGYSHKRGFHLGKGSGLLIEQPVSIGKAKALELQYITLGIRAPDPGHPSGLLIETSVSATFRLFTIFRATAQRVGLETYLKFPGESGKKLGVELAFKPPMGLGVQVDLGFIVGGGFIFLDPREGSYAGVLSLEFRALKLGQLTAVGVLNTKPSVSLMLLLSLRLPPPYIQLSSGFTLNGFGVILGTNRAVNVDALSAGVRNRTIDNILFPDDPVANAVRIINDVRSVFPPAEGQHIFGGMFELGWGGFINLQLGLAVELLDGTPSRFVILAVLAVNLPTKEAGIITLNAALVGVFDSDGIRIDGSLYESRIAFVTISGDMAIRIRVGGDALFLLSVGGFHPQFAPPPNANIGLMRRLALTQAVGGIFRLNYEFYFAVTSNTVQFGAKVELYVGVSEFNVYGFYGFDALIQFDPFQLLVQISAGLAVRLGSEAILSVQVTGQLSGPNPWRIAGKGEFRVFIFSFDVDVNFTFGEEREAAPPLENVQQRLVTELKARRSWQSELPERRFILVALRELPPESAVVIAHPFGALRVAQNVVPLGIKLDRFGSAKVQGANLLDILGTTVDGEPLAVEEVREQFAPGQFQALSDADKLSRPSFAWLRAGVRASAAKLLKLGRVVTQDVRYEATQIDRQGRRIRFGRVGMHRLQFAAATNNLPSSRVTLGVNARLDAAARPAVAVAQEHFAVVRTDDLTPVGSSAVAASHAEGVTFMEQLLAVRPDLTGTLEVVPLHEAALAGGDNG